MTLIEGLLFEAKVLKTEFNPPNNDMCGRSSPFTQEEIEAYGGKVICLRIHVVSS